MAGALHATEIPPKDDLLMDFTVAGPAAKADPWKARLDILERFAASPPAGR